MGQVRKKYRVTSARLQSWDYAASGWYFVTLCTRERKCFFGDVVNEKVQLSTAGEIVSEEWQKTEQIRSHVALDHWVLMPNHLHGILIIKPVETLRHSPTVETPRWGVSSALPPSVTQQSSQNVRPKFRLRAHSLGAIIGQFKSICTKRIREAGLRDFSWQSRFYDHIIRNDKSLNDIREYIANNPLKWELDKNNPENLHM